VTSYFIWTVVAVIAAAGVLLVASVAGTGSEDQGDHGGFRGFVRDVRRGAGARRQPAPEQAEAGRVAGREPVEVSIDEMFRVAAVEGDPYLQVDDLTEALGRARRKAARSVPGLGRR
jgi:hypothetical protein